MWPIRHVWIGLELSADIQRAMWQFWTGAHKPRPARSTPVTAVATDGGQETATEADRHRSGETEKPPLPPHHPAKAGIVNAIEEEDDGREWFILSGERDEEWIRVLADCPEVIRR